MPTPKTISCLRMPFLSDGSCDRGSVDIHMFDALPYCDTINPTQAKVPDEIVDTPTQLILPPACTCVNIAYKFGEFKYNNDQFKASASFAAVGRDCCEGMYETTFNLGIPCPLSKADGANTISVGVGYGNGESKQSKKYFSADKDKCTFKMDNVDLNLKIPCPLGGRGGENKVSASVKWAAGGASPQPQPYVTTDPDKCEVSFKDVDLNLTLPCPVATSGARKISASIAYGDGAARKTEDLATLDAAGCKIDVRSPVLDLNLPCPVKSTGDVKVKVNLGYTSGPIETTEEKTVMSMDGGTGCSIKGSDVSFKLNLHCPVQVTFNTFKTKLYYGEKKVASASAQVLKTDATTCKIGAADTTMNLKLPCPTGSSYFELVAGSGIRIESDTITNCKRRIRLKAVFPSGGGGGGGDSCGPGVTTNNEVWGPVYNVGYNTTSHKLYFKRYREKWCNGRLMSRAEDSTEFSAATAVASC